MCGAVWWLPRCHQEQCAFSLHVAMFAWRNCCCCCARCVALLCGCRGVTESIAQSHHLQQCMPGVTAAAAVPGVWLFGGCCEFTKSSARSHYMQQNFAWCDCCCCCCARSVAVWWLPRRGPLTGGGFRPPQDHQC
jgi:hypothetical protein